MQILNITVRFLYTDEITHTVYTKSFLCFVFNSNYINIYNKSVRDCDSTPTPSSDSGNKFQQNYIDII